MTEKQDFSEIIKLAQEAVQPFTLSQDTSLVVLPGTDNRAPQIVDLDQFGRLAAPRRKRGIITVFNVPSLNSWIFHNKDAGTVTIYCDSNPINPKIVAVLNDNGQDGPGHRDFAVKVEFRHTPEWKKWNELNGKMLPQVEFAEFIEENMADIFDPPGADMLEIASYLQAVRNVDFKSQVDLSNGALRFTHAEDMNATVKAGQVAVPQQFTLAIAPIQGGQRFKIPARFRYRIIDGKLKLGFKLLRIEDVMAEVFEGAVNDIVRPGEDADWKLCLIEGSPNITGL
ncbi:MAG: DUF2303 family protein [Rhodospirillales bacterium]|nr:DUF2303 family protein [Rhodospirillales bacterium]